MHNYPLVHASTAAMGREKESKDLRRSDDALWEEEGDKRRGWRGSQHAVV